jgi:hypothetical protein
LVGGTGEAQDEEARLSFKQGTAEHAVLDQVIKCWFAKAGEYWPGQIVGW